MVKLSDLKNFVQGYFKYFSHLPVHEQEQVKLRAFLCKPCVDNGSCTHCGCKTPQMFYAPSKVDAQQKWAEFLTELQWNALKNNVEQYVDFFKELNELNETANHQDDLNNGVPDRNEFL